MSLEPETIAALDDGESRAAPVSELPFDFIAYLSTRAGLGYGETRARLGVWLRELDRERHGTERFAKAVDTIVQSSFRFECSCLR